MKPVKTCYLNSVNKRVVQQTIYQSISKKYRNLIALGGPNLSKYLDFVSKHSGIKRALIYEYEPGQLLNQVMNHSKVLPTTVVFGDIVQAPSNQSSTLYDLDFCCSVKTAIPHIKKFRRDPCLFTFSIRPYSIKESVNMFTKACFGSRVLDIIETQSTDSYRKYSLITSNARCEMYVYKDTVPMLVITTNL